MDSPITFLPTISITGQAHGKSIGRARSGSFSKEDAFAEILDKADEKLDKPDTSDDRMGSLAASQMQHVSAPAQQRFEHDSDSAADASGDKPGKIDAANPDSQPSGAVSPGPAAEASSKAKSVRGENGAAPAGESSGTAQAAAAKTPTEPAATTAAGQESQTEEVEGGSTVSDAKTQEAAQKALDALATRLPAKPLDAQTEASGSLPLKTQPENAGLPGKTSEMKSGDSTPAEGMPDKSTGQTVQGTALTAEAIKGAQMEGHARATQGEDTSQQTTSNPGETHAASPAAFQPDTGFAVGSGGIPLGGTHQTSLEPARLAEAQNSAILQQISLNIEKMVKTGAQTLHLQLYPEDLGRIDLQVRTTSSGIGITLTADQSSTGKLIQTSLGTLRQSLENAGIQLSNLNIGQQNTNGFTQGQAQSYFEKQTLFSSARPLVEPQQESAPARVRSLTGIDYRI